MNGKVSKIRNVIFWLLVAVFAIVTVILTTGLGRRDKIFPYMLICIIIILLALGTALVALTVKLKETRMRKLFFILTGVSVLAIPICVILHNLVYVLCVKFGWMSRGDDEAVFFILVLLVFPALFIIGALGSIVLLIRDKAEKKDC